MVMMAARHEKVDARVWDQFHSKWWPLMPWKSLTYSHQADFSIDSGTVTLPGDHPLGSVFTQVRDGVPAPIRITLNGIIWDGQIKTATKELRDGVQTWTLTLASDSKHLHRMLARPPAQSAADNAEDTITGFLGDVLTKIVSVAAARTGLPTYIIQAVEGDPVELGIRTEDTVADVLGDALSGSNAYLETRMLLPEDDIPSGTGVKLYQGDVERQWAEASRAELWPHAKQDALVTDLKPASAPALPPFSYKGSASISTTGSDYQTPTWGYCYRPFQTVATANPYFEDGQRKPEPGTRVITEDDLAENHDRWGAMGVFVAEWQAGTFALKKDHQLLADAVKAGLVRKTDGTVFKSTAAVYSYAGDSELMYAWRDTVAWVVATDSDMRAELKRRTPWGTPAWRIPGLLVRIFGERDRRGVVFSSASGGGLSGFSVTHEAPDGAMLLAGGTVDQMALDAIQRGVSGAAEYGTQVDYSPTEAAQALGAQMGGQFTAFNADVQPKATLANSEVAFHKAGGKVDLAKAGPFFYRERYMNLTSSSTAPISEMVQEWNKAQGSTSVALTTGGAVNAVFGNDVRHEDGTITPGWREGDRVSFVDDETRISEVITGYEVRAEAGNALEVTPKLGRTDNGVMAELANRLRGAERTATQANLSQAVRVPAAEVDNRAQNIVDAERVDIDAWVEERLKDVTASLDISGEYLENVKRYVAEGRQHAESAAAMAAQAGEMASQAEQIYASMDPLRDDVESIHAEVSRLGLLAAGHAQQAAEEAALGKTYVESAKAYAQQALASAQAGEQHVNDAGVQATAAQEYAARAQKLVDDAQAVLDGTNADAQAARDALAAAQGLLNDVDGKGTSLPEALAQVVTMHQEVLENHSDILDAHRDVLEKHGQAIRWAAMAASQASAAAISASQAAQDALRASSEAAKAADDAATAAGHANRAAEENAAAIVTLGQVDEKLKEADRKLQAQIDETRKAGELLAQAVKILAAGVAANSAASQSALMAADENRKANAATNLAVETLTEVQAETARQAATAAKVAQDAKTASEAVLTATRITNAQQDSAIKLAQNAAYLQAQTAVQVVMTRGNQFVDNDLISGYLSSESWGIGGTKLSKVTFTAKGDWAGQLAVQIITTSGDVDYKNYGVGPGHRGTSYSTEGPVNIEGVVITIQIHYGNSPRKFAIVTNPAQPIVSDNGGVKMCGFQVDSGIYRNVIEGNPVDVRTSGHLQFPSLTVKPDTPVYKLSTDLKSATKVNAGVSIPAGTWILADRDPDNLTRVVEFST